MGTHMVMNYGEQGYSFRGAKRMISSQMLETGSGSYYIENTQKLQSEILGLSPED